MESSYTPVPEEETRPLDFDTPSLKTAIKIYKDYIVPNFKVSGLLLQPMMVGIPETTKSIILNLERQANYVQAASTLLDELLKSDDEVTWSLFKDALKNPEHALIRDILERGYTDDLHQHHQRQNLVSIFMRLLVEKMVAMQICELLLQEGLLTQIEAQEIRACCQHKGEHMANLLMMSCVPKSKNWYSTFMKTLYDCGLGELVKTIDPIMHEKIEAQKKIGEVCGREEVQCHEDVAYASEEAATSAKLKAADDEQSPPMQDSRGGSSRKKRSAEIRNNLASGGHNDKALLKKDKKFEDEFTRNITSAISSVRIGDFINIVDRLSSPNPPHAFSRRHGTSPERRDREYSRPTRTEIQTLGQNNQNESVDSTTDNSGPGDEEIPPEIVQMLLELPDEDHPPDDPVDSESEGEETGAKASISVARKTSTKSGHRQSKEKKIKDDRTKEESREFFQNVEGKTQKYISRFSDVCKVYFGTTIQMSEQFGEMVARWQEKEGSESD